MHDRLGPANLIQCSRLHRSDRSHQWLGQVPAPRFEYRIKGKKEEQKPVADPEKSKADVIQIGEIKVPIKDTGKKPMDIDASVDVPWPGTQTLEHELDPASDETGLTGQRAPV